MWGHRLLLYKASGPLGQICVHRVADSILVSILFLTLAQATALNFLAPLGAMVLARYLDYGSFGYIDRIGGLVALAGVVLVVQPDMLGRDDKPSSGSTMETAERLKAVACGMIGVFGGIVSQGRSPGAPVSTSITNSVLACFRLP